MRCASGVKIREVTAEPRTLLLADDHELILEGMVKLLDGASEFSIVARCTRGDDALEQLKQRATDIAVVDISMPGLDGLQLVQQARQAGVQTRFVLLTMHDDLAYVRRAEQLGVPGFVLKDAASSELLIALRAVAAGGRYVSSRLLERMLATHATEGPRGPAALGVLTPAERAVLAQLAKNQTSRQIAKSLGVSYRTVQNHRANICAKLELRGPNRLLEFALEHRAELQTGNDIDN